MNETAAKRYAEALLESVWGLGDEVRSETAADLARLAGAIAASRELRLALENPSYGLAERLRALDAVIGRLEVGRTVGNFARLVVERGRAAEFAGIEESFRAMLDERSGRVRATVRSAVPLDDEDVERVRSALERRTGRVVQMEVRVDPSLIGGIRAEVGSIVYDGSIRAELDRLRETLGRV